MVTHQQRKGPRITSATPPLPTNQDPPSSLDCITNYTANTDLSLQDHEQNKLNQTNNRRTTPPISGDDVIGNLLHNQMILTPVAIDAHGRIGPMVRQNLYGTPPPAIPPRKQFKPNRPNAKAMYDRATTLHPSSPHRHFHRSRSTMETTSSRQSTK
jgi:hypothetical protein